MSAGFKYDLVPPVEQEERYDVSYDIRSTHIAGKSYHPDG